MSGEVTGEWSIDFPPMPPAPLEEQAAAEAAARTHQFHVVRAVGACAIVLGSGVGGSVIGAHHGAFTPTDIKVGPHDATIQLDNNHAINVDGGMPGYIDKQTSWWFDTGVSIKIEGIPAPTDQATMLSSTDTLLSQYAVLGDKQQAKNAIEQPLITRVWHDSLEGSIIGAGGSLGLVGIGLGAWAGMGDKRKQAFRDAFRVESTKVRRTIAISSLAGIIAATACTAVAAMPEHHVTQNPNAEFVDTPLQGFATHGYYLNLAVNTVVPLVTSEVNGIQAFSDTATKNLKAAFAAIFNGSKIDHKNYIVTQLVSDNHCGIAMDEFHAEDAKLFDADATLDMGDVVPGGLPIDDYCAAAEVDPIMKHNPVGIVNGNHGPLSALSYAQKRGAVIIDGNKPVKLGGLTVEGQGDVMVSTFGSKITQRGSETVAQEADAIKQAACKNQPDIVVGHEPAEVLPTAEAGCAKVVIAGHTHVYQGLTIEYTPGGVPASATSTQLPTYYMNVGTSSGAAPDSLSIATPTKDATEEMCLFDRSTHNIAGCYVITTDVNANVTISPLQVAPGSIPAIDPSTSLASK